ncbi:hypothetical protein AAGW05_01860 [Arthrobacter sp. LAPM80]|uniref:hypothetical protein n=1 Tax=Arthrobacter sp. LAPM80 TaxID=3141788 RepID=UPI00398B2EF6
MALLSVVDSVGFSAPQDVAPVENVGSLPVTAALSTGQAKDYAQSADFATLQKMLASFKG